MSHHHHHHHHHNHHHSPRTYIIYTEKSNRIQQIIGIVFLAVAAVMFVFSILGFVEVLNYDIAIPFLIVGVVLAVFGVQVLLSALSDKKAVTGMTQCPDCGVYNKNDVKVCGKCGKTFGTTELLCPKCGAILKSEGEVCADCGYASPKNDDEDTPL